MDILSDKIVTTRKSHKCDACGRLFPAGTKMNTQVNVYDGIQTWRSCMTCYTLMLEFKDLFFDDVEYMYPADCVYNVLENGQTPEWLLEELKKEFEK